MEDDEWLETPDDHPYVVAMRQKKSDGPLSEEDSAQFASGHGLGIKIVFEIEKQRQIIADGLTSIEDVALSEVRMA